MAGAEFLVGLAAELPLLPPEPELDASVAVAPSEFVADALLLLG